MCACVSLMALDTKPKHKHRYKPARTYISDQLTDDDYRKLPPAHPGARKYHGATDNGFVSVSPSILKFPHDDVSQHSKVISIWNKSRKFIAFRIEQPTSKYFTVSYGKSGIFGGAEADLVIKCRPSDQQMYFDCFTIHFTKVKAESIIIPVEIIPSISWFALERVIMMPVVALGKSVEHVIQFPTPPGNVRSYNFYVTKDKGSKTSDDEVELVPTLGEIGSGFVDKLTLTYTPKSYTTIAYKFSIHFPEIAVQPYTITAYMRCVPGIESDKIAIQTQEELNRRAWEFWDMKRAAATAKLRSKSKREICTRPTSKKHLRPIEQPAVPPENNNSVNVKYDLTTPAGVHKFLLQRGGKIAWTENDLGPLGLTLFEQHKIYKQMEKEFRDNFVRIQFQRRNLVNQPTKVVLGEELIETIPGKVEELIRERDLQMAEYQKALGVADNDPEDMFRKTLKLSRRRVVRDVAVNCKEFVKENLTEADYDRSMVRWFILRPFIQAALLIITRKRADKRLAKLKQLPALILQEREAERARLSSASSKKNSLETPGEEGQKTKGRKARRKSTKESRRKSLAHAASELHGEGGRKPHKISKGRRGSKKEKRKSSATDDLLRQESMKPEFVNQDQDASKVSIKESAADLPVPNPEHKDKHHTPAPPPPTPMHSNNSKKTKKMSKI